MQNIYIHLFSEKWLSLKIDLKKNGIPFHTAFL